MPEHSLVPRPAQIAPGEGSGLVLDAATGISCDEAAQGTALWLRTELGAATGLAFPPATGAGRHIRLSVDDSAGLSPEGYRLTIDSEGAKIVGHDPAGVFYGAQTLRQLLPPAAYRRAPLPGEWRLPATEITDRPRFGWRGCMIDVARHFLPKHDLLRLIDLLALHKLNVLHLHLSDDQGWRVEIKRYPRLTEVASWRHESQVGAGDPPTFDGRPHGGFYTQDDIREIVAYAGARHIRVVPEIDIPGHSQAAIAAYPELGESGDLQVGRRWGVIEEVLNVSDATLEFYRNVFDEIMELFPDEYVCVGGDECPKGQWRNSPIAQERIKSEGLADEDELQSWFIRAFDRYFTERGRRLLGWDEILEGGLAPGATVASWRGREGGIAAARAGHDVVMCPTQTSYLDYRQSDSPDEPIPVGTVLTLADVYASEPVPTELTEEEARHVLGAQVNVWTEHMDSPRRVDYMVFPRLSAFAETVWSSGERDYAEFLPRLTDHLRRLDAIGVEYRPLDGPRPWQRRPGVPGRD
ncbi:hexosaminidase [Marinactinospora thermotolerans DSM 45154]|uniref:beta-N-acetylhexosaminidase n=1 Tax=Marinactinospora thermotolerans DSM 45154 TaxID=1122192 RepID=A0A1T4RNF5_9ACTN|nr:beta-N-acetylhexosaminidase [Marinactinospora thermotolerans]SKA17492.1 hexosaminidase [Marinactinospora thermotolerans DSM 45154]